MIQAVREKILPNIIEVLGTQVEVTLENSLGDKIVGYADLVVRWRGEEKPVVLDFKTSTRKYDRDSVLVSPQLTLYVHGLSEAFEGTRRAGYVVLYKAIKKNKTKICSKCGYNGSGKSHKTCDAEIKGDRCHGKWVVELDPEVDIDVIIGTIPEQTEKIVIDNMDYINETIKTSVFHRNFQSCVKPWGKCTYFNLCYSGKDDTLTTLGDSKDERTKT